MKSIVSFIMYMCYLQDKSIPKNYGIWKVIKMGWFPRAGIHVHFVTNDDSIICTYFSSNFGNWEVVGDVSPLLSGSGYWGRVRVAGT